MKSHLMLSSAFLCAIACLTLPGQATDLKIDGVLNPGYFIENEEAPVQFVIRNDNILLADRYTSSITIENQAQEVVFATEVEGRNLPPFTTETVTTAIGWRPELTGKYHLSIGVDFSQDIDTSNNQLETAVFAIINYNEAADRLVEGLSDLGPCDPNLAVVFMPHEPLAPGDTVTNVEDIEPFSIRLSADSYKWFAYADFDPGAKYAHPGALVVIDGMDGTITSTTVNTWPVINDEDYMADPFLRESTEDLIYGSLPPVEEQDNLSTLASESPPASVPGQTCAILVSGKIRQDWERSAFNFDLDLMEGNLRRESLGLQLNSSNIERIGNATAGEICDAIKRAQSGYDKIVFYYSGHGNKGWMVTNDPVAQQLGYLDLANKLYATEAKDICVIIDACYAGTAEGSFRIPFEFTQKNVTLVMAAMSTKTSLARVIQETATGERVWSGFFTWHFAQCYGDPQAESDGDSGISIAEAFNWVRAQNPAANDGRINQLQNPVIVTNRAQ